MIGQALLAQRMGKPRVIAETGAGQHGVATATIAARYGMECVVYMGAEDIKRQAQNVYRMKLLGATVVPVESGSKTLKDALNEAMRDWVTNVENTFYIIGTVAGPHPYPMMVRDFQSVIGREAKEQMLELTGRQPDAVLACVGGGSNAMGIFYPYIEDEAVRLIGVEAAGTGSRAASTRRRCAPASRACCTAIAPISCRTRTARSSRRIRFRRGSIIRASVPEHAWLKDSGRAEYVSRHRRRGAAGVPRPVPARRHHPGARIEPRARLRGEDRAARCEQDKILLVNLSGRGDKDMHTVAENSGIKFCE